MSEDLSIIQEDNYSKVEDYEYFDDWETAKQECVIAPKYLAIDGELFVKKI